MRRVEIPFRKVINAWQLLLKGTKYQLIPGVIKSQSDVRRMFASQTGGIEKKKNQEGKYNCS